MLAWKKFFFLISLYGEAILIRKIAANSCDFANQHCSVSEGAKEKQPKAAILRIGMVEMREERSHIDEQKSQLLAAILRISIVQ